jgi:DNA-binding transcriptional MerR regulator
MSLPRELFTISRVSEMTGFPPDRLAWLEEELGEEFRVRRTPAGNRLFTQEDIDRLLEVKRLLDDEGWDVAQVRATLYPQVNLAAARPADTLPGYSLDRPDSLAEGDYGEHDDFGTDTVPDYDGDDDGQRIDDEMADDHEMAGEPVYGDGEYDDVGSDTIPDYYGRREDDRMASEPAYDDPEMAAIREPRLGDDLDPEDARMDPLPVDSMVDILLEAAEGLVQENLKLGQAVDSLGERCVRLEERLDDMNSSPFSRIWQRLFSRN